MRWIKEMGIRLLPRVLLFALLVTATFTFGYVAQAQAPGPCEQCKGNLVLTLVGIDYCIPVDPEGVDHQDHLRVAGGAAAHLTVGRIGSGSTGGSDCHSRIPVRTCIPNINKAKTPSILLNFASSRFVRRI